MPPAPSPRRFQEPATRTPPVTAGRGPTRTGQPGPADQRSPLHLVEPVGQVSPPEPSPSDVTATNPQVVPLDGGLALVAVGQWDEDTSTIRMPKFTDTPAPRDEPDPTGTTSGPTGATSASRPAPSRSPSSPEAPRPWHDARPDDHSPTPWRR